VGYELLDAQETLRRFGLRIGRRGTALFQAEGGVLQADTARGSLLRAARQNGVELIENTLVRRLAVDSDAVLVETTAGDLRARAVVVTAGPWTDRIVRELGIVLSLTPIRETVAYFQTRFNPRLPTLSDWRPARRQVNYGLVTRDGLLKIGVSGSGSPSDPDEKARIDPDVVLQASEWAARHFPLVDSTPIGAESCLYTNTSDERFIIERHGRIIAGSACSGHGFKFAPVVGERLAALALDAAAT
jgi:glycine/D-amino acid oxidase-like deaminating enzyme